MLNTEPRAGVSDQIVGIRVAQQTVSASIVAISEERETALTYRKSAAQNLFSSLVSRLSSYGLAFPPSAINLMLPSGILRHNVRYFDLVGAPLTGVITA